MSEMAHITRRAAPLIVLLLGCARPAAAPVVPTVEVARAVPVAADGAAPEGPDRRAQRAWCGYLDALYRRASGGTKGWPKRAECLAHQSNAAPEMLERTATCSQRALDSFESDPLTPEYADAVRTCGAAALESLALSGDAVDPWVASLCRSAEVCGQHSLSECRATLDPEVRARLGRAIGALNGKSRARLMACFDEAACDVPLDERIVRCIEPIMEDFLWLPGEG